MYTSRCALYLGCEVREADCFVTIVEDVPNCSCFENLSKSLKGGIRDVAAQRKAESYCPMCQTPIDRKNKVRRLKFWSTKKAQVEAGENGLWPSFLQSAALKPEGLNLGYRIFPLFTSVGEIRRDAVMFGLPVWNQIGKYNGDYPAGEVSSSKFDDVKEHLKALGVFHAPSYRLRLYFGDEPSAPTTNIARQFGGPLEPVPIQEMPRFAVQKDNVSVPQNGDAAMPTPEPRATTKKEPGREEAPVKSPPIPSKAPNRVMTHEERPIIRGGAGEGPKDLGD